MSQLFGFLRSLVPNVFPDIYILDEQSPPTQSQDDALSKIASSSSSRPTIILCLSPKTQLPTFSHLRNGIMPTERQVLRSRPLKSDDDQQHDGTTATTQRPLHPVPPPAQPAPALEGLVRALEKSPPELKSSNISAKLSAAASGIIHALENPQLPDNEIRIARKKPAVSDDDDGSQRKKKSKLNNSRKLPIQKPAAADKSLVRTMDDFNNTIDDAVREQRIDNKKAARLQECLQSGDWSEVAFSLMCEQIPLKRKGKGHYECRVCQVPKRGHKPCPYCHICSTATNKFKNDEEHVCFNCPLCFEAGKKKKKLIQVKREGHVCPYETTAPPLKLGGG